jgi:hypothetical protein
MAIEYIFWLEGDCSITFKKEDSLENTARYVKKLIGKPFKGRFLELYSKDIENEERKGLTLICLDRIISISFREV